MSMGMFCGDVSANASTARNTASWTRLMTRRGASRPPWDRCSSTVPPDSVLPNPGNLFKVTKSQGKRFDLAKIWDCVRDFGTNH